MKLGIAMMVMLMGTAYAMPPSGADASGAPPHTRMDVGQLEGTLTKNGRPQAGKEIVIQVQQGGQTLLTLPKKTDEKGQFIFKNIFRDPQYSYILLTEDEGRVYHYGPVQLTGKQDTLKVAFAIAPENAVEMNAAPMPPESPRMMPHEKAPAQWQSQQMVSIVLACLVLVVMAYALGRYRKKK